MEQTASSKVEAMPKAEFIETYCFDASMAQSLDLLEAIVAGTQTPRQVLLKLAYLAETGELPLNWGTDEVAHAYLGDNQKAE